MSRCHVYRRIRLIGLLMVTSIVYAQTRYFPPRALDDEPKGDEFLSQWYSTALKALDEPSLWERSKSQKEESYRFLWLRTFHHPVAVRIDFKDDGSSQLTVKMTSGAGGYNPGALTTNRSTALTNVQTDHFSSELKKVDFWNIEPRLRDLGLDGAEWIIEGVRERTHGVVTRWSPKDGPVRELGLFMLEDLAGMNIPPREMY